MKLWKSWPWYKEVTLHEARYDPTIDTQYNFRDLKKEGPLPLPEISEEAEEFSELIFELFKTKEEYESAKCNVSEYTGQWNPLDYYMEELALYKIAKQRLWLFVSEHIKEKK
jgi:hypothetical protein